MPRERGGNDPRIQFVILISSDMGPQAMQFLKVCKWCLGQASDAENQARVAPENKNVNKCKNTCKIL